MVAGSDDEADDGKRDGDLVSAERFADLVDAAGGSTAAARILKRSRNAVEKWATGKSRLPFDDVLTLAMHVDGNLNRFAIGADEEVLRSPEAVPVPVYGNGAAIPDGFVSVPALDVQASAGSGALTSPFDVEGTDIVAFREAWLRALGLMPGRVHIVWARGDSMQPTIRDGDMLLVDRTIDRVLDNGIYIVVVAGAVLVKRLTLRTNGSVVLRSDNDRYPEELIPADEVPQLIVEGRVRWVGGPI